MGKPVLSADPQTQGPPPARRFVVSVLLGLAGFAGSFASPVILLPPHTISIAWHHIFPLLAAMAYGPRYGLVAGTIGLSAFAPFHMWPANGWANAVTVLFYLLFYGLHGRFAVLRRSKRVWWNNPFVVQLLFAIAYGAATVLLYPPLFAQNPPFWAPAAATHIPGNVVIGIVLKGAATMYGCVLAAVFLFKTSQAKRLLGLESPKFERLNGVILVASLGAMAAVWLFRAVLLAVLAPDDFPRRGEWSDEPREVVALIVITVTCLTAGYLIALFVERRNRDFAALRQGEERYRLLVENANEGIYVLQDGLFCYANRNCCEVLGVPLQELLGRSMLEFLSPTDKEKAMAQHGRFLSGEIDDCRADFRFLSRGRQQRWVAVNTVRIDWAGRPATLNFATDVTESRRAEAGILQEKNLSERIINSMPGIFCLFDTQGKIERWNRNFERVIGYTPEEIRARHPVDFVPGEQKGRVAERIAEALADGAASVEAHIVAKDGTATPYLLTGVAVALEGRPHVIATGVDVTENRRTDEAQKARLRIVAASYEKSARELMQLALDEIEQQTDSAIGFYHFILEDEQTIALQAWSSRTLREMCTAEGEGSHYPVSQGGVWVDCVRERAPVIHNDYPSLPHRKGLPPGHAPVTRELVLPLFRDGRIVAIVGVGNKPTHYGAADVDIVAYLADFSWEIISRRQAEERVRASLAEKELLLREIHHRVKNNLQIVASLFKLTNRYAGDPKVDAIFRESQNRIRAMADVHSMLYRSQIFSEIAFDEYLRETARQLFRTYNTNTEAIALQVDAEETMLPIDAAIPCGLIINELISNALKHAFPAGRRGRIEIGMRRNAKSILIRFGDDGVGFPAGVDFRSTDTLGLQLVNLLVAQLGGTIERVGGAGTHYKITLNT